MARSAPVSLQLWVAGLLTWLFCLRRRRDGALPLRPKRPGHCPVLHLHCRHPARRGAGVHTRRECRAWARRWEAEGTRAGSGRSSEAFVPFRRLRLALGGRPSTPHCGPPPRLLVVVFIHGRELPEVCRHGVIGAHPARVGDVAFTSRLKTCTSPLVQSACLQLNTAALTRNSFSPFVGRAEVFETCPLSIHLHINTWVPLSSLENQQTASSLQSQAQQVQRIWAAGRLSSQLGDLVLLCGGDGEWSS